MANAVILPHAVRFNADAAPDAIAALSAAIGVAPEALADEIAALVERLGLPTRLVDCGVNEADLEAVARLSQSNGSVKANPRPVTEADAADLLAAAF